MVFSSKVGFMLWVSFCMTQEDVTLRSSTYRVNQKSSDPRPASQKHGNRQQQNGHREQGIIVENHRKDREKDRQYHKQGENTHIPYTLRPAFLDANL